MFIVSCASPLDNIWEDRDKKIIKAAGRISNYSDADYSSEQEGPGRRNHIWVVRTFREAAKMKAILEKIEKVHVTIREK